MFSDDLIDDYPEVPKQRRKRSTPQQEYNIEIMVVADRKMAEYHGAGFKEYVLVLMNTVSTYK